MKIKRVAAGLLASFLAFGAVGSGMAYAETGDGSAVAERTITLKPNVVSPFNDGVFEGWGTSLCWWGNRTGFDAELTDNLTDWFFDEEKGLGLDIIRYNIGGGDDPTHDHVTRSDSKMPGFAQPLKNPDGTFVLGEDGLVEYEFDYSQDARQLAVLKSAIAKNSDLKVEAFSNSPPYFMTNSGCTSGGTEEQVDNLNPQYTQEFADFLVQSVAALRNDGINVTTIEPMNEPRNGGGAYNGCWPAYSYKQEGCNINSSELQSNLLVALDSSLKAAGLDDTVMISASDDGSPDFVNRSIDGWSDEATAAVDQVNVHTYSTSWDNPGTREETRDRVADMGKRFWMSEICGVWEIGDSDMSYGLGFADHLIDDMRGLQPSAWLIWQASDSYVDTTSDMRVESEENRDNINSDHYPLGTIDVDNKTFIPSKKYYTYAQFTKYIEKGDIVIDAGENALASYNPATGKVAVVVMNPNDTETTCSIDFSAFEGIGSSVSAVRTSVDENLAELADMTLENGVLNTTLKESSVTTFVVEPELEGVALKEFYQDGGRVGYPYEKADDLDADVYTAIYDKAGTLIYMSVNEPEDEFYCDDEVGSIKCMAWNDSLAPMCDADEEVNNFVTYAVIEGLGSVIVGASANYTLDANIEGTPVWSVKEPDGTATDKAEITADGELRALAEGTVLVSAQIGDVVKSRAIELTTEGDLKIEFEEYFDQYSWTTEASAGTVVDSTRAGDIFYLGEVMTDRLSTLTVTASATRDDITMGIYAVESDTIPTDKAEVEALLTDDSRIALLTIQNSGDYSTFLNNTARVENESGGMKRLFARIETTGGWGGNYDYITLTYGDAVFVDTVDSEHGVITLTDAAGNELNGAAGIRSGTEINVRAEAYLGYEVSGLRVNDETVAYDSSSENNMITLGEDDLTIEAVYEATDTNNFNFGRFVRRIAGSNGLIYNDQLDSAQNNPAFYLGEADLSGISEIEVNYAANNNGGGQFKLIALDEYTSDAETVKAAEPFTEFTTQNTDSWSDYTTATEPVDQSRIGGRHIYLYIEKSGWCGNYRSITLR